MRRALPSRFGAILLLFFLSTGILKAQFLGVGIGGGGNQSTFTGTQQTPVGNPNDLADQKNKFGGGGGIKLDWKLFDQDWLLLSPELYLQQKGSKEYYNNINQVISNRSLTLDYGGVLLPLKLGVPGSSDGETTSTLLYGQINLYSDYAFSTTSSDGNEVKFARQSDKLDLGYSAFVGFTVGHGIYLQAGYHRGLKNIKFFTEATNSNPNSTYIVNNKNFSLSIVYMITN